jgi:hypothetical protein
MTFPPPCRIREAAVALEQIQLFEVEEVLVAGSSPAGLEQLLLDEASNTPPWCGSRGTRQPPLS